MENFDDVFQSKLENSSTQKEDDEYVLNEQENSSVENITNEKTKHDFKCAFKNCEETFYDMECDECKSNGESNKCFCALHSSHEIHKPAETVKEAFNEDNDVENEINPFQVTKILNQSLVLPINSMCLIYSSAYSRLLFNN